MNLDIKFTVADMKFELCGSGDVLFEEKIKPYISDFDVPDFSIDFLRTNDEIAYPAAKKLTDKLVSNWYINSDGTYELAYTDFNIDKVVVKLVCDIKNSCAKVILLDVEKLYGINAECLLCNSLEIVLHFLLLHYNGFVVHASSIAYKGTGLAFSAESGTGKSTHTALWLKNCPDDTVMLNDDKPIFRYFENDGWYIYGTPWAGTTGLNTNLKVPLKALVFLERSKTNSIRRLASAEVISRFFEAVISPMSDEITDKILELLGLLIEKSNVCLLKCNMENEAMETVKKFLYE